MSYTEGPNRPYQTVSAPTAVNPAVSPIVEYHDRVRWGPIFAGMMVSIASQLVLSTLGATIGFATGANGTSAGTAGTIAGIWAIISLLVSLFLGGWMMAITCGPMNKKTAMLNATILWATSLAIGAGLLASGISGTFGVVAANAGAAARQLPASGGAAVPNVSAQEVQQYATNAASAALGFLLGALLSWVAALIGATVGAKTPRPPVL